MPKTDFIKFRIEGTKKKKFARACRKLSTDMTDTITKHIDATIRLVDDSNKKKK